MRDTCNRCRPINKGVHTPKIIGKICASASGTSTLQSFYHTAIRSASYKQSYKDCSAVSFTITWNENSPNITFGTREVFGNYQNCMCAFQTLAQSKPIRCTKNENKKKQQGTVTSTHKVCQQHSVQKQASKCTNRKKLKPTKASLIMKSDLHSCSVFRRGDSCTTDYREICWTHVIRNHFVVQWHLQHRARKRERSGVLDTRCSTSHTKRLCTLATWGKQRHIPACPHEDLVRQLMKSSGPMEEAKRTVCCQHPCDRWPADQREERSRITSASWRLRLSTH